MARFFVALALAGVAVLVLMAAALQVPGISNWAGQRLLGIIPLNEGYALQVGRITGNWLSHLELENVALLHQGDTLARLGLVAARYTLGDLLRIRRVGALRVADGRVVMHREGDSWDLIRALDTGPAQPGTDQAGGSFGIGALDIHGVTLTAAFSPDSAAEVHELLVRGRNLVFGDRVAGQLDTLHVSLTPPGSARPMTVATRGSITRDAIRLDTLDVRSEHSLVAGRALIPRHLDDPRQAGHLYVNLRAAPLALADVARFHPAIVPRGELNAAITARATGSVVNGDVTADVGGGKVRVTGSALVGVDAPTAFEMQGEVTGVEPARIVRNGPRGPINSTFAVALAGERLTTSDGEFTIRVSQGAALRLTATGQVAGGRADVRLRAARQDVAIAATGVVRPFDSIPSYRLRGTARQGDRSGRFAVAGSGIAPQALNATATVALDPMTFAGRVVDSVVANASVAAGDARVTLTGRVATGPLRAALKARPFDSLVTFTLDSALLQDAEFGLVPLTIRARATGSTERIQYQATLRSRGGTAEFSGEVSGLDSTMSFAASGRLDSLNAGELFSRGDLDTRIAARFEARGSGSNGTLDLEVLESRVREAQLGPGTVRGVMKEGRVTADARFTAGDLRLTADVSPSSAKGNLKLLRIDRWSGDSALAGDLAAQFDVHLASDSLGIKGAAGSLTATGHAGAMRLDTLRVALGPDTTRGIAVDTFVVRSNLGTIDGSGLMPLRDSHGAGTVRLVAFTTDLDPLTKSTSLNVSLDSAQAAVTLVGPAAQRHLLTQVRGWRVLYATTVVETFDASILATVQGMAPDSVVARLGVRGLAAGTLTVREAEMVGWYDSSLAFAGSADLGHGIHVGTAVSGGYKAGNGSLNLERLDITEGNRRWGLTQLARVTVHGKRVAIRDFELRSDVERSMVAAGTIDAAGTSDFSLILKTFDLGEFQRAGLVPIAGILDGSLALRGPATMPRLTSTMALTLPRRDEYRGGLLRMDIDWSRRELRGGFTARTEGGTGRLEISGVLPWGFVLSAPDQQSFVVRREPGDTMSITLAADTFDVGLFEPFLTDIERLRGLMHANARIIGTPEDPRATGSVAIDGLGMRLRLIDVTYEDGRLVAELDGAGLRVDTLRVHTDDDEWLLATGKLALKPLTNPQLYLDIALHDFLISAAGTLEASAAGDIKVSGTLADPTVTGSLVMGHTELHVPESGSTGESSLTDVKLTEADRLVLARHFGVRALARVDKPITFLDPFTLDLELRLPEQVWFRRAGSPKIDVEVAGTVRLRQQPYGEMEFFGTVEPLAGRSTLDVFGRTFDLVGGDIALRGPIEDARITVNAQYHPPVPGSSSDDDAVIIEVTASGRTDSLGLDFSSTPSMPREDIISYVVTGRPASDNPLIGGSGQGIQGDELAFGQLSDALSDVVSERLGFDVFQLRLDGNDGMVLTAGRYLTPKFFVSLRQPLELGGSAAERTPGTTLGPGFELQYRLQTWLRLNLRGGSLPPGVLLRGGYAY